MVSKGWGLSVHVEDHGPFTAMDLHTLDCWLKGRLASVCQEGDLFFFFFFLVLVLTLRHSDSIKTLII